MRHRYESSRFDFSEADAISEYLTAMAEKGWQLDRAGPYLWRYRKAKPRKLRYAIGYLPGIHSALPLPPEKTEAFRALYEAAGWTFVTEWYFVQIFAAEDPAAVAPDTDETVKLEALRRSVGKQLWANVFMAAFIALLLGLTVWAGCRQPLVYFSSNTTLVLPWVLLVVILTEIAPLFRFLFWNHRARRALSEGGVCPPLGHRFHRVESAALWLVLLVFAAALISDGITNTGATWTGLRLLVWVAGLMVLNSFHAWVQRHSGSKGVSWAVLAVGLFAFLILYLNIPDGADAKLVSQQALPLSSLDLGSQSPSEFCLLDDSRSVLLRHVDVQELSGTSQLSYDAYYPATDWIRDLCRSELEVFGDWGPESNGIRMAFLNNGEYSYIRYLIETPEALILLYPAEPLDEGQLETVISRLIP